MADKLYAFEVADGAIALYRDIHQTEHVATIFDGSQVGEYFQASDGWAACNYRVVRIGAAVRGEAAPVQGEGG